MYIHLIDQFIRTIIKVQHIGNLNIRQITYFVNDCETLKCIITLNANNTCNTNKAKQ